MKVLASFCPKKADLQPQPEIEQDNSVMNSQQQLIVNEDREEGSSNNHEHDN